MSARVLGLGWAMDRGLELLQERLEEAAAAVKATATATRNKNKYKISMEIRRMATATAKCRNPGFRKDLMKKRKRLEHNSCQGGCDSQEQDYSDARREEALEWAGQ